MSAVMSLNCHFGIISGCKVPIGHKFPDLPGRFASAHASSYELPDDGAPPPYSILNPSFCKPSEIRRFYKGYYGAALHTKPKPETSERSFDSVRGWHQAPGGSG